jgi:hypothetical protein
MFVTSQGHTYAIFTRAVENGNVGADVRNALVATSDWSRAAGANRDTQKPTKQEPLRLAMPALARVASPTTPSSCVLLLLARCDTLVGTRRDCHLWGGARANRRTTERPLAWVPGTAQVPANPM